MLELINGAGAYSPETVAESAKHPIVLSLGAFAWFCGLVQVIAALVAGFRDKSHGVPLFCAMFFFAHDISYFANYSYWFHESPYEMTRQAWFQMGPYALVELAVVCQALAYSRAELFPGMSFRQAAASVAVMQVFVFAFLWWILSILNDPLWMYTIMITVIMPPLFLYPMMRARGSRKGVNLISVGGIAAFVPTFWLWLAFSDAYFRQPVIVVIALCNVAAAVGCFRYYFKLPPYRVPVSRAVVAA